MEFVLAFVLLFTLAICFITVMFLPWAASITGSISMLLVYFGLSNGSPKLTQFGLGLLAVSIVAFTAGTKFNER